MIPQSSIAGVVFSVFADQNRQKEPFADGRRHADVHRELFGFIFLDPFWLFMALCGRTSLWEVGIALVEGLQLSEICGDYVVTHHADAAGRTASQITSGGCNGNPDTQV